MGGGLRSAPVVSGRMGSGLQLSAPVAAVAVAVAAARGPLDAEFPAELRKLLHLHGDLPHGARGLYLVGEGPVDGAALLGRVWAGGRGADCVGQVRTIYGGNNRAREELIKRGA